MSNHTPEPWDVWRSGDGVLMRGTAGIKQGGIALTCCNENVSGRTAHANARRIVACVNACRGLATNELEQKGIMAAVGTELLELDKLVAELRDLLRQAIGEKPQSQSFPSRCDAALKAKGEANES